MAKWLNANKNKISWPDWIKLITEKGTRPKEMDKMETSFMLKPLEGYIVKYASEAIPRSWPRWNYEDAKELAEGLHKSVPNAKIDIVKVSINELV